MPPIVELTAVTAAAKAGDSPLFSSPEPSSDPTVAVSATTEPFIPAKNMDTSTFACAMLPRILPIMRLLNSTSRSVMVALVMSSPVSMKNGIAVKWHCVDGAEHLARDQDQRAASVNKNIDDGNQDQGESDWCAHHDQHNENN